MAKTPAVKKAPPRVPDKLTWASLVGYLAEKNGLARRDAKRVISRRQRRRDSLSANELTVSNLLKG